MLSPCAIGVNYGKKTDMLLLQMSDDTPISPQLLRQHIRTCDSCRADTERRTRMLEEALTEHRMRLENGTHAFQKLREEHAELRDSHVAMNIAITPKPPSLWKITGVILGIIISGSGALWTMSTKFSDRPTMDRIHGIEDRHQASGHKGTDDRIRAVRDVQIEQTSAIKNLKESVGDQGKKLDILIKRTGRRRDR